MFQHNYSLTKLNTFGIDASAKHFATFSTLEELLELISQPTFVNSNQNIILGGGSNILFTQNVDGVVLKNNLLGIQTIREDDQHVWIKVGAGEIWHQFVMHCVSHNLGGVENLSLIPGCVGASPMQNIGAYGVEIKDVFESLTAYHLYDKTTVTFSLNDCAFGYRESVFKNKWKNQFVILDVTFRLAKTPVFNTSYGAIEQQLEQMSVQQLSVKAISDAVISIRQSKLPDPAVTGNAGSFFKNPTIKTDDFSRLQQMYPTLPGYDAGPGFTKVAAGWLIEQCGWKGYRNGDAGVHPKQALVLVNYGKASGKSIYDLSSDIKESVKQKFGIELEREVNIL